MGARAGGLREVSVPGSQGRPLRDVHRACIATRALPAACRDDHDAVLDVPVSFVRALRSGSSTDASAASRWLTSGAGAFDTIGGEVVSTAAFVRRARSRAPASCSSRIVDGVERGGQKSRRSCALHPRLVGRLFAVSRPTSSRSRDAPIAYWLPSRMLASVFSAARRSARSLRPRRASRLATTTASCATGGRSRESAIGAAHPRRGCVEPAAVVPLQQGRRLPHWYGNTSTSSTGSTTVASSSDRASSPSRRRCRARTHCTFRGRHLVGRSASGAPRFTYFPPGYPVRHAGPCGLRQTRPIELRSISAFSNSSVASRVLLPISPDDDFRQATFASFRSDEACRQELSATRSECVEIARQDWDSTRRL